MISKNSFCFFSLLSVLLPLAFLLSTSVVLAHGVIADQSPQKSYGFQFSYDDGTDMQFAEVKVYGPNDSEKVSQVGRTNVMGTYAFIPPEDGKWLLKADDGQGHLAQVELDLTSKPQVPEASTNPSTSPPIAEVASPPPVVNVDRIVSSATKPYKMAVVILALIALGLGWKVFSSSKSTKEEPPKTA